MLSHSVLHVIKSRKALLGVVLFAFLALFVIPDAMAGKPGGECVPRKNKTCPDPVIISGGDTSVIFDLSEHIWISDDETLDCNPDAGGNNTQVSGNYFCVLAVDEKIFLATHGLNYYGSIKTKETCKKLDYLPHEGDPVPVVGLTPSDVSYGWTDDCSDDGICTIEFRASFTDAVEVGGATGGAATEMGMLMSGQLTNAPMDDANPFKILQEVEFDRIDILMTNPASRKPVGDCIWGLANEMILISEPD